VTSRSVAAAVAVVAAAGCKCGSGGTPRGGVGAATGAAIVAAVTAAPAERAPWRCAALDEPSPPASALSTSDRRWTIERRAMRLADHRGPSRIAFVADAGDASPATLANIAKLTARLAKLDVHAVVGVGGLGSTEAELAAVLGALAGERWVVIAIPGDREAARDHRAAIAALAAAGKAVVDGAEVRWIEIGGFGVATLPGQSAASRLAHGVEGCGHADADAAAVLTRWPDGGSVRFRALATQRAPRRDDLGDVGRLGAHAGDVGLADALAGSKVDLVIHAAVDGIAAVSGRHRAAPGVAWEAVATGMASGAPHLDGRGERIAPSAIVVTVEGDGASWQPISMR
jgi:hypothetical protein